MRRTDYTDLVPNAQGRALLRMARCTDLGGGTQQEEGGSAGCGTRLGKPENKGIAESAKNMLNGFGGKETKEEGQTRRTGYTDVGAGTHGQRAEAQDSVQGFGARGPGGGADAHDRVNGLGGRDPGGVAHAQDRAHGFGNRDLGGG